MDIIRVLRATEQDLKRRLEAKTTDKTEYDTLSRFVTRMIEDYQAQLTSEAMMPSTLSENCLQCKNRFVPGQTRYRSKFIQDTNLYFCTYACKLAYEKLHDLRADQ